MKVIEAHKILRHRPPFRFVDQILITEDARAVARLEQGHTDACWAADPYLSVLPVEYAAQLMGVLIRTKMNSTGSVGVLAGLVGA